MTILRPIHFLPRTLVTFLVVIGLLFSGVRVPDLSKSLRPHRPKATNRLVWESQQKNLAKCLKPCAEQDLALTDLPSAMTAGLHAPLSDVAPLLCAFLPVPPTPGRSPPSA